MRLHDRNKFEIHVFATTPPDNAQFLKISMKGVDWRKKIKNANQTASLIRSLGIHILLNWDGYSNEGVRVAGLFPLQSAPLQVAHQEYIGTMGADYIQYLITGQNDRPNH
jgi:protein O-GlcNAc transferase